MTCAIIVYKPIHFWKGSVSFPVVPDYVVLMTQLYNWLCNVTGFVYDSSVYHGAGFLSTKIVMLKRINKLNKLCSKARMLL